MTEGGDDQAWSMPSTIIQHRWNFANAGSEARTSVFKFAVLFSAAADRRSRQLPAFFALLIGIGVTASCAT